MLKNTLLNLQKYSKINTNKFSQIPIYNNSTAKQQTSTKTKKTKREMPKFMTVSNNASQRLQYLLSKKDDPSIVGVKVGVKERGCNGLTYTMNYINEGQKEQFDEIIENNGIKVVIDSKALIALVGTEMDYVEDDLHAEFVFNNPNSKGTCGCGESFFI